MGRNRDTYWDGRRALNAYRARKAFVVAPRNYAFDRAAVIRGESGRVCLEQIMAPLNDAPQASWRVIARWAGPLPPGSLITVDERRLVVLRVRPMKGRRTAAHLLCREDAAWA